MPGLMTATVMERRWVYYRLRELADAGSSWRARLGGQTGTRCQNWHLGVARPTRTHHRDAGK